MSSRREGMKPSGAVSKHARISTIVGAVIAVLGIAFVVRAITRQWDTLRSELADARPEWLVLGVVCAAVAMLLMALPWRAALRLLGGNLERLPAIGYYFAGEIAKYVPGGIWPVVGRGELARSAGVPAATAYASVALSLGALYLAAMVLVMLLLPLWISGAGQLNALWVLALLPVGLAMLHPRPLAWLVGAAERMMRRDLDVTVPPWTRSLRLVARYLPAWLFVGTATWCIARAFDGTVAWIDVVPAAVLSWIVGFVLVPIPGGLGVREAVFVGLASALPSGIAATVAIAARLSFMLVDGLGAVVAGITLRSARHGDAEVACSAESATAEVHPHLIRRATSQRSVDDS